MYHELVLHAKKCGVDVRGREVLPPHRAYGRSLAVDVLDPEDCGVCLSAGAVVSVSDAVYMESRGIDYVVCLP